MAWTIRQMDDFAGWPVWGSLSPGGIPCPNPVFRLGPFGSACRAVSMFTPRHSPCCATGSERPRSAPSLAFEHVCADRAQRRRLCAPITYDVEFEVLGENAGLEVPEVPRRGLDLKGQVISKIRLLFERGSKTLFPSNLDRGEGTCLESAVVLLIPRSS